MLEELREFCMKTMVTGELTHLLVEGIYWSLQDSPLENVSQYPHSLQSIIQSQESIGWDQLFSGRFSMQWRTLHHQQLQERGYQINRINSGIPWVTSIIRILWKHIHQVWIHRNQVRHGATFSEQLEKQRQLCVAEVSLYYDYKTNDLLAPDLPEHIFYPTLQEHLHKESKLSELDQWLCNYRDIILTSKQNQQQLCNQQHGHHQDDSSFGGSNRSSRVDVIL